MIITQVPNHNSGAINYTAVALTVQGEHGCTGYVWAT